METNNEIKKVEVTYDSLNAIKYHLMKEEFEKLGIGDAFKGGAKKEELIEAGLASWARIKEAKKADLAKAVDIESGIEEEIIFVDPADLDIVVEGVGNTINTGGDETEGEENDEVVESPKYTRTVLEKAHKSTKANLANGIVAQRNTLLKKLEWIEAELENCED